MRSIMINFKLWLRAVRAPFFTATIIPVAIGAIAAWSNISAFSWFRFWLTMLGAILIHGGTNLANDYFDHLSGCDEGNPNPTPFSGGSRVIQDGLIAPRQVLYVSLAFLSIGGAVGLYLNHLCRGNVILILGVIGIFLGFFYTAKPFRIGYCSFGELAVGIGFGPLMVLGAYFVQTQNLSFSTFLISIPIGILVALIVFINEFPDHDGDKKAGKKTMVVVLGKKRAAGVYRLFLAFTYITLIGLIILKILPLFCLIVLLTLPLALKASLLSRKNFNKVNELLPANALTIGLHLLIGLLLCAGIALDKIF